MRWNHFGKITTEEGHKVFFSAKEDKHEHGVGFLVHKDIVVNTVMGCRPVAIRLITIRLRAVPFNITVVQAYSPTSDYEDNEIEHCFDQLQNVIEEDTERGHSCCARNWQGICRPSAVTTPMRKGSDFWSLPQLTIFCWRTLLVIAKHPEDGPGILQMDHIDYILVRQRVAFGIVFTSDPLGCRPPPVPCSRTTRC